jgi:hypothetical protein
MGLLGLQAFLDQKVLLARLVQAEVMERQAQLAYREMWDQQEQLEFQGMMELQVLQAQRD